MGPTGELIFLSPEESFYPAAAGVSRTKFILSSWLGTSVLIKFPFLTSFENRFLENLPLSFRVVDDGLIKVLNTPSSFFKKIAINCKCCCILFDSSQLKTILLTVILDHGRGTETDNAVALSFRAKTLFCYLYLLFLFCGCDEGQH